MAVITSTNTAPIYTAPGESWALALRIKNDNSKAIAGIRVRFLVTGSDLGTDAGTVYCGYFLGGEGTFADVSIAAGKSVNVSGFITPPESLEEDFAPDVRIVPVYVKCTVKYKDGSLWTDMDALLENVHVLNHRYDPLVRNFMLERAADGQPNDEGEDVLTTLKLSLSDPAKTGFMGLTLYYEQNAQPTEASPSIDLTARIPELLNGVVDSPDLIFNSFSNGSDWNFLLIFGDEYESSGVRTGISRAFANLHLSGRKTGGACFGGFSISTNGDPKLESHYTGYFYKGISGVNIFSEDEVLTGGRWIDGKPIYTRVIAFRGAASETMHSAPAPEGVETLWIDPSASFCVNSNGYVYPVSHTSSADARTFVAHYYKTDNTVRAGTYAGNSADMYVKIFYTKAADAPFDPNEGYTYFTDIEGNYFVTADDQKLMTEVF